ncbi:MAG: DUF1800 family protein, partial [Bacteroidia bacterium]|nr:DUF1800 family protein [Bacteroidia bacterium]
MSSKLKQISHLYKRAAFDVPPSKILLDLNTPLKDLVQKLFDESEQYTDLNYLDSPLNEKRDKEVSKIRILKSVLRSKKDTELLNLEWVNKISTDKAQLRERMTYFWHDHFACGGAFAYLLQVQNNTLRKHALGNFGDM